VSTLLHLPRILSRLSLLLTLRLAYVLMCLCDLCRQQVKRTAARHEKHALRGLVATCRMPVVTARLQQNMIPGRG
jgi:hypothetical protein